MLDVSKLGALKLVSDPTHESMNFECLIWGCFILQTFSSWTFFSSNRLGWNIARDGYFPMKCWFMAAKLPKSHWTVATEAVSNTFIIFTSIPWGFYDPTSLKHNMFQTGGWFFKPPTGRWFVLKSCRQGAPRQRIPREFMLQPIGLRATQSMVGSRVVNSLKTSTKLMRKFSWKVICRW